MRWPLRNQILLPMVGVMLAAIVGVSWFNVSLSARRARERIEGELTQVVETLVDAEFPLTDAVLGQMRGLSGAEFVLADSQGGLVARSSRTIDVTPPDVPAVSADAASATGSPSAAVAFSKTITVGDKPYFHTSVEVLPAYRVETTPQTLHIYYPQASYEEAWRDVVTPPIVVGAIAMVIVVGLSFGIASRVTRPLVRLQRQVDEIADGTFRSMPVPTRNDETADLSRAVNGMADKLARYEQEVRRSEQLRTLGQLGGGIAHQMRNSVTGCRMAVELHARTCPATGDENATDDSLAVARRQLELMENYLRRFLALGQERPAELEPVTLQDVISSVVALVEPTARHLMVALCWAAADPPVSVLGDSGSLQQMLVNILLNGIEAAAESNATNGESKVSVLLQATQGRAIIEVADTGAGPPENVQETLFEPFVSEKADGVGLGLSVARETAASHGGGIDWRRQDGETRFRVELPLAAYDETSNPPA